MGQVSKLRSMAIQVEGWDAILTAIYRREDPLGRGIGKSLERRERMEYCIL